MKRSFTDMEEMEDETIALKRARKYLGAKEDVEVAQSPFFSSRGEGKVKEATVEELDIQETAVQESIEMEMVPELIDEQLQVSCESSFRKRPVTTVLN